MTSKLKGLVEKKEKLKKELKLIEAKFKLYIYLSRLQFYYRYIDNWVDEAEVNTSKPLAMIKQGGVNSVQTKKVNYLLFRIYNAAKDYYKR